MDKEREIEKKFDWGTLKVELIFKKEKTEEKFWKIAEKRGFLNLFNERRNLEAGLDESVYCFLVYARANDFVNAVRILKEVFDEFKNIKKDGYRIKVKFELEKVLENERRRWSEVILKGNSLKKLYSSIL